MSNRADQIAFRVQEIFKAKVLTKSEGSDAYQEQQDQEFFEALEKVIDYLNFNSDQVSLSVQRAEPYMENGMIRSRFVIQANDQCVGDFLIHNSGHIHVCNIDGRSTKGRVKIAEGHIDTFESVIKSYANNLATEIASPRARNSLNLQY